jgi:hypothetical protein
MFQVIPKKAFLLTKAIFMNFQRNPVTWHDLLFLQDSVLAEVMSPQFPEIWNTWRLRATSICWKVRGNWFVNPIGFTVCHSNDCQFKILGFCGIVITDRVVNQFTTPIGQLTTPIG